MTQLDCPRIAIYPGTFDPFTNGHLDIVNRALTMFDKVIITLAINAEKNPLFTLEERCDMIRKCYPNSGGRIEVNYTESLLVDFAHKNKAQAIIRGLRAVSDFDYEFQLALMNRRLEREVETIFLMAGFRWIYISSSIIKDAARHGGDIHDLVPQHVEDALQKKFKK